MRSAPLLLAVSALLAPPLAAQDAPSPASVAVPAANAVEVRGVLPGPGFWKVTRGGNTVWILASIRPVPRGMEWETIKLERKLADAQLLIGGTSVKLDADIGFFGKLGLVPSLLKARRNPDGKTLQQVLPPETYARWLTLKARYIGNDRDIEQWRPIFAAQELYEKAIRKAGLRNEGIVWPEARELAEDAGVPIRRPEVRIRISDPKRFIKEFNQRALSDVACFEKTLDSIERDVRFMAARGRAWAEGDMAGLRAIPLTDNSGACIDALVGSGIGQSTGLGDAQRRAQDAWLQAVDGALAEHRNSVAVANIDELMRPGGLLQQLRARGHAVTEPDALP
ncbi:MAG: TraB/GumN family protein [Arenimonas sp.]